MKEEEQLCDYCSKAKAILYCRADTAKLCLPCDMHVHKANTVSSKHSRSLLCNSCNSSSSSIFCPTHNEVYCSNCDYEAHVSVNHHERRTVESFCGCPSAVELILLLGFGGNKNILKEENKDEVFNEESLLFWDAPPVVRLNDLIVPLDDDAVQRGIQAFDVPPLPKDRNLACGKQKEEILHQLRELLKSEGRQLSCYLEEEVDPVTEFQTQLPDNGDQQGNLFFDSDGNANFTVTHELEASEIQWNSNDWQEATNPAIFPYDQQLENYSMETSSYQDKVENFQTRTCTPDVSNTDTSTVSDRVPSFASKLGLEIICPDRNSVLLRYKEKRKARRYDKLIRYESRKARADSRVRIKGRFAKLNQDANS